MLVRVLFKCLLLFVCVLAQSMYLTACSNLESGTLFQSQSKSPIKHGEYKVQKGDSLYSIAWRFKRDYKELAAINNIKEPYIIHVDQVIKLATYQDEIPSKSGYTGKSIVKKTTTAPPKVTSSSSSKAYKNKNISTKSAPSYSVVSGNGNVKWQWPAKGAIIQTFSSSSVGKKGIQIAGNAGDPIAAAADGQVVYSGNSLVGYGNLVIIKHNDTYLTAYAHNRRVSVKEGNSVKQGQVIAEMGASGTDRNKLHFEIRKEGQPVNPMLYLPKP